MAKKIQKKHDYENNLKYLRSRREAVDKEFLELFEELISLVKNCGIKNAHIGDLLVKLDNLYSSSIFYDRAISIMEGHIL
jgi:hypothetical protein